MSSSVEVEQGSGRFVAAVAGESIAVTRAGAGPAVICLHAIGHSARDFVRLGGQLGSGYEIITLDWPGHGHSRRGSGPVTARHYAELLAAVIDALQISSAYILGNSIGGAAAMLYAASHPDRVRGLVLCNPAGLQRVGVIGWLVCRRMAGFFAGGIAGGARFQAQYRRYYERDVLPSPAASWRREEIIAAAQQSAPLLTEAWKGFALPPSDLRHLAPTIACRVLLAWARHDKYIAWSRSKRAALGFPDQTVRFFEGGHSAFLEQPAAFADAFREFVGGTAASTTGSQSSGSTGAAGCD
jgi:4,5:9,10-diseco-3-hydroxy-5,9,17-trioxoandrosta-1(10),2-diene-4-oate hydrolase